MMANLKVHCKKMTKHLEAITFAIERTSRKKSGRAPTRAACIELRFFITLNPQSEDKSSADAKFSKLKCIFEIRNVLIEADDAVSMIYFALAMFAVHVNSLYENFFCKPLRQGPTPDAMTLQPSSKVHGNTNLGVIISLNSFKFAPNNDS